MTKELRNAIIEITVAILLTAAIATVAGDVPAWGYLVTLFAGLGIGSVIATRIDAARPAKSAEA